MQHLWALYQSLAGILYRVSEENWAEKKMHGSLIYGRKEMLGHKEIQWKSVHPKVGKTGKNNINGYA